MKTENSKHQKLVDIIFNSLLFKPYVKEIYKNIEYGEGRRQGELDVFYINEKGDYRYIEVKTTNSKKLRKKARIQGKRFVNYFDDRNVHKRVIRFNPEKRFKIIY